MKNSETYKSVISNDSDVVTAIPFYTDSGILITTSNIKYVIESQLIEHQIKLEMVREMNPDYPGEYDISEKLKSDLEQRIGKNMLDLKFIYVNKTSIDDAINDAENLEDFHSWG